MIFPLGVYLVLLGLIIRFLWWARATPRPGDEELFEQMAGTPRKEWTAEWRLRGPVDEAASARLLRWPFRASMPMVAIGAALIVLAWLT